MCRITKRQGYLNTQADALRSDTVTVTDIRYFMAAVDSTMKSFRLYMRNIRVIYTWYDGM